MKINFPITLTAADSEKRTLTGKIVSWDEKGFTSAGATMFAKDSIDFSKPVKLLLEHRQDKPIGKLQEITADDSGITASFKLAKTFAADDAIEEAIFGIRDGFSVGVEVDSWDNKDGIMVISSSFLREVSLVSEPAIASARVESVIASEQTENSEAKAEDVITTEGEQVSDTTVPEAPAVETVEAARVEAKTSIPNFSTKVRNPITSPATFLEHSVRAALGDDDSKTYVKAASDGTLATEIAGLNQTPQLTTIWDPKSSNERPAIAAIRNAALPANTGLKFQIPRVKTAPTVAAAAEKGAFSDTQVEIEYVDVNVAKYAGMQKFDVEVLDLSTPAFFDELVRLMGAAYASATDAAVYAALAAGTADGTVITLPWDGDEFSGFISRGAASIFAATKRYPTGVVMTPGQWANLIALNDSNKRPLFNVAGNPQNGFGQVSPTGSVGSVLGLPIYVSPNASGVSDDSIIMVNSDSFAWYESASPLQLRTNIVGTGQVEVGYYGYGAIATLSTGGAFTLNV
jgi:HK97 family phage prohead protease/HK97 family phage major capsid protein